MLDTNALLNVLPKALEGWFDVFVVTAVIIAATYILNKTAKEHKE